jgi:hypothetical protein
MCGCTCGAPQKNPCAQGTLAVQFGDTACGGTKFSLVSDGQCDAVGANGATFGEGPGNAPWMDANGTPLAATQVACDATGQLPALTQGAAGRTCTPGAPTAGTCPNGDTCLPTVTAAEQCIQMSGTPTCPSGFTHPYVVYASGDIQDKRTCSTCACTSQAATCSKATLTTYTTNNCTGTSVVTTIDGNCDPLPNGSDNHADTYFLYTATPNTMDCTAANTMVSVMGSVETSNPITICCP